jgi:hypothetical protein
MTLLEYIEGPHRWAWGGHLLADRYHYCDCTLYAADWVLEVTGRDPGEDLRRSYSSAEEANAIVDDAGGMVEFVASRLEPLGFKRVQEPQDGDVGIVEVLTGFDFDGATVKLIPGVRFGPLWSVMSARGSMTKKLAHCAVWRIA